jgi:hypothetical protein
MPIKYYSRSRNYYGKVRSNSNRNNGYPSRKRGSGFYDSMPDCQTRINNGYKQFQDPRTGDWVYIHRRVMEKKLGGNILHGNEVHHKTYKKRDNRPENLVVMPKQDHQELHSLEREPESLGRRMSPSKARKRTWWA